MLCVSAGYALLCRLGLGTGSQRERLCIWHQACLNSHDQAEAGSWQKQQARLSNSGRSGACHCECVVHQRIHGTASLCALQLNQGSYKRNDEVLRIGPWEA